ncbi:MAG TPA: hypothetical protein VGJ16_00220 [Pirellulales bacterium]|jgi:hypothetical protein
MRVTSLRMLIAVLALALPSQWASAQIATGNANAANAAAANGGTLVPGIGTLPGQTQLTPQQLMGIAQLRALQSRGRGGGVRTGYPQYIPMGPQNMMGPPALGANSSQGTGGEAKTSTQRRMEARQAREEQKRAARDDAKAKGAAKGKNAKNAKAKNAKVAQKATAEPQAK